VSEVLVGEVRDHDWREDGTCRRCGSLQGDPPETECDPLFDMPCGHYPVALSCDACARAALAAEKAAREEASERESEWRVRAVACARERDETREALRKYVGPARGNEPVCERDALLAQLEEAERALADLRAATEGWGHMEDSAKAEKRAESAERREKALREALQGVLRTHGHSNPDTDCPACARVTRALLASVPAGGTATTGEGE
jgi:hypothetical protein